MDRENETPEKIHSCENLTNRIVLSMIVKHSQAYTKKELPTLERCPKDMRDAILRNFLGRVEKSYGNQAIASFLNSDFRLPHVSAKKTKDVPAALEGVGDEFALRETAYVLGCELEETKAEIEVEFYLIQLCNL